MRTRAASIAGSSRASSYVSIRQHTSAYVSICHTSAFVSTRQHTSAYVSTRQHTPAHASTRQHTPAHDTPAYVSIRIRSATCTLPHAPRLCRTAAALAARSARALLPPPALRPPAPLAAPHACAAVAACVQRHLEETSSPSPRLTSAYVSIRQHTSAYVSMRQHTSAYVTICHHTSAYVMLKRPHRRRLRRAGTQFTFFTSMRTPSKASKLST